MSDNVYNERIVGKKVSVRCKECLKLITVDGNDPSELAARVIATGDAANAPRAKQVAPAPKADAAPPPAPAAPTSAKSSPSAAKSHRPVPAGAKSRVSAAKSQRPVPPPPPKRFGGGTLLGLPPLPPSPPRAATPPAPPAIATSPASSPLAAAPPISRLPVAGAAAVSLREAAPAIDAAATSTMDDEDDGLPSTERPPPPDAIVSAPEVPAAAALRKEGIPAAELTPSGMAVDEQASSLAAPQDDRPTRPSLPRIRVAMLAAAAAVVLGGVAAAVIAFDSRATRSATAAAKGVEPSKSPASPAKEESARTKASAVQAGASAEGVAAPVVATQERQPAPPPSKPSDKNGDSAGASATAAGQVVGPDGEGMPAYVSKPAVLWSTTSVLRRATRCHPGGHAVGTVDVFMTFAKNGHVTQAHLEGEPVASAPVANCILDYARAVIIPKFEGEPFTLRQQVTMR